MKAKGYTIIELIITIFIICILGIVAMTATKPNTYTTVTCIDTDDSVYQVRGTGVIKLDQGGYEVWIGDRRVGNFPGMRCSAERPIRG